MNIEKVAKYYRQKNKSENKVTLEKMKADLVAEYKEEFTMKSLTRGAFHALLIATTLFVGIRYGSNIPGFLNESGAPTVRGIATLTVASFVAYLLLVRAY